MNPVPPTPSQDAAQPERRGFLGVAAAGLAGILLAPGVRLIEIAQAAPAAGAATAGADPQVRWGMLIDSTKCSSGCTDCVTACRTENGLPENPGTTGAQWIRKIEIKEIRTGKTQSLPVMCQHCNHAPCETVCPVGATVHSREGLNHMAYNRCIGTRYCANNCPYKVRRFNWFKYADNDQFDYNMNNELGRMVLNPDVIVRSRGVMEKCTMCVQRIQYGKLEAKKAGRRPADGEITTACAQSCPTQAITFGDYNDANSKLSSQSNDPRAYHVLEELNVQPSIYYQTKVRNKETGNA